MKIYRHEKLGIKKDVITKLEKNKKLIFIDYY